MDTSIATTLGAGSGIDIRALVTSLSAAAKAPRDAAISRREEANAARVSSLASIASSVDSFSAALASLVAGGSLASQPSVSHPAHMTASALPGARLNGLSAAVEVRQLAMGQTLQSAPLPDGSAPVGQGTVTVTTAAGGFPIQIDAANDSLAGLATAINATGSGVRAQLLTDTSGTRLVLKGATGAAQAFTLTAAGSPGLDRFTTSGGLVQAQAAQDALLIVDGVEARRATNGFSDLLPGVKIDLKQAAPGIPIAIGVNPPTAAIEQAVQDFVTAYNELGAQIAAAGANVPGASGALRGDIGLAALKRDLAALPTKALASTGSPRTLAQIGVRTGRDGTLSLDIATLRTQMTADSEAVEALFNPGQSSSDPRVVIKSAATRVRPGTYALTDLVAASGTSPASGRIDGALATGIEGNLVAPAGSRGVGLILGIATGVTSATVTIDPGLAGALRSIRDGLSSANGPFAGSRSRLSGEAKALAAERETLDRRSAKYSEQLLKTYTAMDRQVSGFKATQSYLDQQVKIWTNGNN